MALEGIFRQVLKQIAERLFLTSAPLPQHHIQLIHHLCPIGIIENLSAQQIRLAWAPEKRICQMQFRFERRMGGDEFIDAHGVVGQAELFEQGREAVGWVFHV
jgi:hypothetical protein